MLNRAGQIESVSGLISFWDFQESEGSSRVAKGPQRSVLRESAGGVATLQDGVFGDRSAVFGSGPYLRLPRTELGRLNLHGPDAQVSVVAWLKRSAEPRGARGCEAVAGIWNEHALRQYCLFLNLGIWASAEQVCGHISNIGGATPGYKYCMDASIGATAIPMDRWVCCAITYDAQHIRSYLNGRLDPRPDRNPYPYPGGIFDGGTGGAELTVGAVTRPAQVTEDFKDVGSIVANRFYGQLGGLAIFDRALTDEQVAAMTFVNP